MENNTDTQIDVDAIDFLWILASIALTVQYTLLSSLLWIMIYFVQHYGRRTKIFRTFIAERITAQMWVDFFAPEPLTPVKDDVPQTPLLPEVKPGKPKTGRLTEPQETSPFWTGILTTSEGEPLKKQDILSRIPTYISYDKIPAPQTKLAVPIGYGINDQNQLGWLWGDFGSNTIHGLIAGQSGTGKDTLLKLWFIALTRNNKPSEVKFVVLDGKGEWVVQPLINAQHMLYPPVGGINMVRKDSKGKAEWYDRANDDIADALNALFDEINRRTVLFKKYSVANIERYREKTGLPLPYIIIFATDVGTNAKELELLLQVLVSKGRSLGIRLIISMQTTSNQSTAWRSNLSLTLAGNLQLDSQDGPVMGIPVDDMIYRPSKLPAPKKRPGIFVMRSGDEQAVVQVPYVPDEVWEMYISNILPQKDPILALDAELTKKLLP